MIYIVTGLPRSGTSMMMRCLVEAGMDGVFDQNRAYLNTILGADGYQPNPNGFYSLATDFRSPEFPSMFDGKLVKVPHSDLLFLAPGDYKIVFMMRHPKEILASMRKFFPGVTWGAEETPVHFYDLYVPSLLQQLKEIEVPEKALFILQLEPMKRRIYKGSSNIHIKRPSKILKVPYWIFNYPCIWKMKNFHIRTRIQLLK